MQQNIRQAGQQLQQLQHQQHQNQGLLLQPPFLPTFQNISSLSPIAGVYPHTNPNCNFKQYIYNQQQLPFSSRPPNDGVNLQRQENALFDLKSFNQTEMTEIIPVWNSNIVHSSKSSSIASTILSPHK
eukprot:Awhi_evm2s13974